MNFEDRIKPISKTRISYIASLARKKIRERENLFVSEGRKCVFDMIDSFNAKYLIIREELIGEVKNITGDFEILIADEREMKNMSSLSTPPAVMAVLEIPDRPVDEALIRSGLTLMLDGIQDPGNLGTIIRVADWFGVRQIFASHDTVDVYNGKTIQATMGSLARVNVVYKDLDEVIASYADIPVYGTLLDGNSIFNESLSENAFLVMGNEGNGISPKIRKRINCPLLIPSYPVNAPTCESLNVGVATAIALSEFRRRLF